MAPLSRSVAFRCMPRPRTAIAGCGIIRGMNIKLIAGLAVAVALAASACAQNGDARRIDSDGIYPCHLQGVCTDGVDIWWSHTTELARTDGRGKVLAHAKNLESHHGDLCIVDGTLYVAVNLGKFNTEDRADSWVYAYKGDDLTFIKRWKVPELRHGAGGITHKDGRFFVVGGLPPTHKRNYVYEYAPDFTFVERHILESGWTNLGIQTADYADGKFVFGCYGGKNRATGASVPKLALVTDPLFGNLKKVEEDVSVGNMFYGGRRWKGRMEIVDRNVKGRARRYRVSMVPVKSDGL